MGATVDRTTTVPKRVLMAVANPGVSEMTGWPIGFWASELVHPWHEFVERGYEVTIASPEGGKVEVDGLSDPRDDSGYSADDILSMGFLSTPRLTALLERVMNSGKNPIEMRILRSVRFPRDPRFPHF